MFFKKARDIAKENNRAMRDTFDDAISELSHLRSSIKKFEIQMRTSQDEMEDTFAKLEETLEDIRIGSKPPMVASGGIDFLYDDGRMYYWAQPRIDKHSVKVYDSIKKWCEENYLPDTWEYRGKSNPQFYFVNEKDRDWFLVRWS